MTASVVDKGLANEAGLRELRGADIHPFTSFIAPNEMTLARPLSLLCSGADKADIQSRYSLDCSRETPAENSLAGQVVLIGQDSTTDQHLLFGQQLPGFYLQANYIESLLDGRYLKPIGGRWNLIIFILWLGGLYLLFWIQPEKALLIGAFSVLFIKLFLVPFMVSKGYYLDLWVLELGLIALPLKYIESRGHLIIESFRKLGKEHQQNENKQNIHRPT
ncbi:MAG TPA: hypothetical protein VK517_00540 [Cyclobacteriaceae bacterium]|nr:hypothetical protein [Cyclobacteriaceae bacterium]